MGQITHSIKYQEKDGEIQPVLIQHELEALNSNQLLVKISAAGLNRADLLQRQGIYKVPSGETEIPGVEIAGHVVAAGSPLNDFCLGKRVCGVVSGGGFSEYCILEKGMMLEVPEHWSNEEAAAFPEAALTANEALMELAQIRSGEKVLIHAATSGMGTMLVSMAKILGATVICTTTTQDKAQALYKLGADYVIAEEKDNFHTSVINITKNVGVDAVVDFLAGNYFNANIAALKIGGRLVMAGVMDGYESSVNWIPVINKRINIYPLTLRMKSLQEKEAVTKRFIHQWWNGQTYKDLKPILYSTFPLASLNDAQLCMQKNKHVGKIVVTLENEFEQG